MKKSFLGLLVLGLFFAVAGCDTPTTPDTGNTGNTGGDPETYSFTLRVVNNSSYNDQGGTVVRVYSDSSRNTLMDEVDATSGSSDSKTISLPSKSNNAVWWASFPSSGTGPNTLDDGDVVTVTFSDNPVSGGFAFIVDWAY